MYTRKQTTPTWSLLILVSAFFFGSSALLAAERSSGRESHAMRADGAGFEAVIDPAEAFFSRPDIQRAIDDPNTPLKSFLDQVHTLEHDVPVGDDRFLRVTETFTLRSWLRWPHRAVLFLSGSAFRGNHWSIPVEGYDGTELAAEHDMFSFTVDYLGVGDSTIPQNGHDASFEDNVAALRRLVRYIRFFRLVPKIDLVGEGYGGSAAVLLAEDAHRVRSVSMSAMLFLEAVGGPLTDPFFIDLLQSSPDGYFPVPGDGALIFMAGAPVEAQEYVANTQGGFYPTDNFLVATDLPFYDPGVARAPGLVIYGPLDFIVAPTDPFALAAAYGESGAVLEILETAGHAPRTEGPGIAEAFWSKVFAFIDP